MRGGRWKELFFFQVATKKIVVSAIVGTHCGTIAIMRKPRSRRLFHSRSLSLFFLIPSTFLLFHSRIHLQPRETPTLSLFLSRVAFVLEPTTTSIARVIENCKKLTTACCHRARLAKDVKTYNYDAGDVLF
jgi:hypothetical protein